MIVYLDLLIADNFCADAALLYLAVKTVRGDVSMLRILLTALAATAFGVGYTIFCLYYSVPAAVDIIVKYGVAAALPLPAAKFRKKSTYVLCSAAFVGYMFAFSGMLTAFFSRFTLTGKDEYSVNGVPSGIIVAGAVAFAFGAAKLIKKLSNRRKVLSLVYDCALWFKGKCVRAKGLMDTGNRLKTADGKDVAVISRALALRLLEDSLLTGGTRGEKIPVHTVNGNSFMTVFRIERMEIYCADRPNIIEDVAVGVSLHPLGEYDLILPFSFTEDKNTQTGREQEHGSAQIAEKTSAKDESGG